jgi:hypothetical protein
MEQNQGFPWERKAERTTVEPGGQPDVFAARTRDPPALLLRDDLNPLHHAKGMLCLTETEWGCLRWGTLFFEYIWVEDRVEACERGTAIFGVLLSAWVDSGLFGGACW